MDMNFLVKDN